MLLILTKLLYIDIEAKISHGFSCHAIPILIQYSLELPLLKNAIYIFDKKQIQIHKILVFFFLNHKKLKNLQNLHKNAKDMINTAL